MAKPATPGTGFTGPLYVTAAPNETAFAALTAYTLTAIGDTSLADESANIEANLTDIKAVLDAILERLQ